MKTLLTFLVFAFVLFTQNTAHAVFTELSVTYGYKKTSFDTNNYFESQSTTAAVSLYFWEKLAVELSYTDGSGVRQEALYSGTTTISQQTLVQKTQVLGADLIWVLSDRKSFFQPYIKGGGAQVSRYQQVQTNSLTYTLTPDVAVVPSYGVGCKIALTEGMGLKFSYDIWQTPIGGGSVSNDSGIRAGISWVL